MPSPRPSPFADDGARGDRRASSDPAVRTASQARRAVSRVLVGAGPVHATAEADAHLAATELVTNAIRHAGGVTGFETRIEECGGLLRIAVEDADPRHPRTDRAALHDFSTLGGRGWAIVRELAATCAVQTLPTGGKRITVTLPLTDRTAT